MIPFTQSSDAARRWPTIPVVSVAVWHAVGALLSVAVATVGVLASTSTDEVDRGSLLFYVASVGVVAAAWALLRRRSARWTLLVWPLVVLGGLVCASAVAPGATALCSSTIVLAFLYVGLTQPRGTSLLFLPPALAVYVLLNHTIPGHQLLVRSSVIVVVWIAAAELPAWLNDKLRAARAELARLAATDPLTGLPNRRYWDEQLTRRLEQGPGAAVLLVDLDHFKRFNDERGHLAGDEMLIEFGRVIERSTSPEDVVARWGGEEFAIAVLDPARARQAADQIRRRVPLGQTCSIGLVRHQPGESLVDLMRRADEALYRAKRDGRDRVVAA